MSVEYDSERHCWPLARIHFFHSIYCFVFVLFFFQQNMKCFHSSSFSLDTDTVEVKCNYLMLCYTKLAGMLKHNMCSSQQTYCHQFRITL